MKYIFICGCPRSGTTALWRLFKHHENIIIGVERYIFKADGIFSLTQDLFTESRFLTYQKGDTHFPDITSGRPGEYYQSINNRFDKTLYIGDKIPILYRHYSSLLNEFPEAKIVFVFRNIFDIAQSYIQRLKNPDDGWKKDHRDAVKDWNESLNTTLQILSTHKNNFFIIEYEKLFFSSDENQLFFDSLSNFLSLEITQEFADRLVAEQRLSKKLDDERHLSLTSLEKKYIMHHADFNAYKKVLSHSYT